MPSAKRGGMTDKGDIRKRILQVRNAMTREEIVSGSLAIVKRLTELDQIRRASTLMVYLGFGSEVRADDLILWGWVPGALFSQIYPERQFVEFVKTLLRSFRGDPRFVLGVADQVPPDGVIERARLVADLCA